MIDSIQLEKVLNGEMAISSSIAVKEAEDIVNIWKELEDQISSGEGLHKLEQTFLELIEKSFAYGKDVGYKDGFNKGHEEGYDRGCEESHSDYFER